MIMEAIRAVDHPHVGSQKGGWNTFTVLRGGQVVGSLFDIRQAFQVRTRFLEHPFLLWMYRYLFTYKSR